MTRKLAYLCAAVLGVCILLSQARSTEVPYLSGRVNDTAGMLSPETIQQLQAMLKAHEDSTSNQLVVLTIPSLEGDVLEEYSLKVAETWKLGQKGKDNGVLLLISRDDRKVRIEVGYGLEGNLPDGLCGSIIRNEIVPRFKENDYDGGVTAGVTAIIKAIQGAYTPSEDDSADMGLMGKLAVSGFFLLVVGMFTMVGVAMKGGGSWFLYVFLIPFWWAFPVAIWGTIPGCTIFAVYAVGFIIAKMLLPKTSLGKSFISTWGSRISSSSGSSDGGSSWSSSSSSSFSGGGGSFGGGGSSGGW